MKKRIGIIRTLIFVVIIILEALPWIIISYISGYNPKFAIIGAADVPFIRYIFLAVYGIPLLLTIFISIILLILSVVAIFNNSKIITTAIFVISIIALLTTLLSLFHSILYNAVISFIILILFSVEMALYWIEKKRSARELNFYQ